MVILGWEELISKNRFLCVKGIKPSAKGLSENVGF
jgi:hypothetical protein